MKYFYILGIVFISLFIQNCKSADYFQKQNIAWKNFNKIGIVTKSSKYLTKSDAQSVSNEIASIELNRKTFEVVERSALGRNLKRN